MSSYNPHIFSWFHVKSIGCQPRPTFLPVPASLDPDGCPAMPAGLGGLAAPPGTCDLLHHIGPMCEWYNQQDWEGLLGDAEKVGHL